jgi:hypothetical protein
MARNTTNNNHDKSLESIIADVWKKLVSFISTKPKDILLSKSACDIASEAIVYALKNKNIDWRNHKRAEKHLYNSARKISGWFIKNEQKNALKAIVRYTLDTYTEINEGDPFPENWMTAKHSHEQYNAEKQHKDQMELGRHALRLLDDFLLKKGVSPRDISVYKAWELYKTPTKTVSEKYNISSSNLHKIVSTVNDILSCNGRELLDAA